MQEARARHAIYGVLFMARAKKHCQDHYMNHTYIQHAHGTDQFEWERWERGKGLACYIHRGGSTHVWWEYCGGSKEKGLASLRRWCGPPIDSREWSCLRGCCNHSGGSTGCNHSGKKEKVVPEPDGPMIAVRVPSITPSTASENCTEYSMCSHTKCVLPP